MREKIYLILFFEAVYSVHLIRKVDIHKPMAGPCCAMGSCDKLSLYWYTIEEIMDIVYLIFSNVTETVTIYFQFMIV